MPKFKAWAIQVLHDDREIEAASEAEARETPDRMYHETGELDPRTVVEGATGLCGIDEWCLYEKAAGDIAMNESLAGYAREVLAILERDEDWGPQTFDDIAEAAYTRGLATYGPDQLFTRTGDAK